jgi:hypothetical protein
MGLEAIGSLKCIALKYGADEPLLLEPGEGAAVADRRGPDGVRGEDARRATAAAIAAPADGPGLGEHVVAGDRVTLAVSGCVPQGDAVVAAVVDAVTAAGVRPEDVTVLRAPPLECAAGGGPWTPLAVPPGGAAAAEFDPAVDAQTSYIAADAAGRPVHVARQLVDADVVVAIGAWGWDAALGGRGLDGEVWPAFSRQTCRRSLLRTLASRGRRGLPAWRTSVREAMWQLGLCASLRVVPGRDGSLHAAAFGMPASAARAARGLSEGWRPQVPGPAAVTIASLSDPRGGLPALLRAVAAAARVTHSTGTICVASRIDVPPGIVFTRWREGAALRPLVREALGTGDEVLVADAFLTRFFARALGERRLVLLCDLDEATVEGLEFGHAATPEVVERLAHRADSVIVLDEADRMLPTG